MGKRQAENTGPGVEQSSPGDTETMGETRQVNVSMYYPGAVITVNHYRGRRAGGGEYVKDDAKLWMDALGWMIKASHVEEWRLPLHVICSGRFLAENRAPDLSNLSKCTLDAIQAVSGVNDRHMRWHDGTRIIDGAQAPLLFITITEAPENPEDNGGKS